MTQMTMVDVDFRSIPLITSTNTYEKGQNYRIYNDDRPRYFIFEGENDKGYLWQEIAVKLNSWS